MIDATAKSEQAAVDCIRAFAAEWAQHYGEEIEQAFRTVLQILDRRKALLEMAIAVDQQRDQTDERLKRLRVAGAMLANAAFNLKQRDHLTDDERRSIEEAQKRWDAAVRRRRG